MKSMGGIKEGQYSFKCEDNAHWPVAAQAWKLRFVQPLVAVDFLAVF